MFSYTYYIILILLLEEKTILLFTHPIADICFVSIQAWNLNMIQCGSRNLTAVPPDIPMDATAVHLDGNAMGTVLTETFLGRTRLALLHAMHRRRRRKRCREAKLSTATNDTDHLAVAAGAGAVAVRIHVGLQTKAEKTQLELEPIWLRRFPN